MHAKVFVNITNNAFFSCHLTQDMSDVCAVKFQNGVKPSWYKWFHPCYAYSVIPCNNVLFISNCQGSNHVYSISYKAK